jgi:hypothetical protein
MKGNRRAWVLAVCTAGLIALAGCSTSSAPSSPGPTASANGLSIYPASASVPVGAQAMFTGYVPSSPDSTVTWSVTGGSGNGTITSAGVYTAPTSVPSPAQVAITATSGSLTATAVVTVTVAQSLTVSPAVAAIPAGSTTMFTATMNGAQATGVTWEVNGTEGGDGVHGTIDSNGTYSAPLTPPPGGSTVITAIAGGNSGTSTVRIVFSNASLDGNYAFSYQGRDAEKSGAGFLTVVGQFTAHPAGTISGTEDIVDQSGVVATQSPFTGTFSIGPDGRGTVNLTGSGSSATPFYWQIALQSNQHAVMIDLNDGSNGSAFKATGSGTIDEQSPTTALPAGRYVFELSGVDSAGKILGIAGAFESFGNGAISPSGNVFDVSDNRSVSTDDTSLTGLFSTSPQTLSFTGDAFSAPTGGTTVTFDYYLVSARQVHLIETDGKGFTSGDIFLAPPPGGAGYTAAVLPESNFAFTMAGETDTSYAAGGVFISNGGGTSPTATSGSLTGGEFDNNAGGETQQIDETVNSTSYSVDPTTGRISASTATKPGTIDWVGYVTAPVDPTNVNSVRVLMLETDTTATASGTGYLQSATTEPNGSFAFNLTADSTSGSEQDILAQLGINGAAITGSMDMNNFGAGSISRGLNVVSSKSSIDSLTDSDGRGTATFVASDGTSILVAFYAVDANTVLMVDMDNNRIGTGLMLKQF